MKWTRAKVRKLSKKKGPKRWKDRMAIEYYRDAGLHVSASIMNLGKNNSQYAANILADYKIYLLRKALT